MRTKSRGIRRMLAAATIAVLALGSGCDPKDVPSEPDPNPNPPVVDE